MVDVMILENIYLPKTTNKIISSLSLCYFISLFQIKNKPLVVMWWGMIQSLGRQVSWPLITSNDRSHIGYNLSIFTHKGSSTTSSPKPIYNRNWKKLNWNLKSIICKQNLIEKHQKKMRKHNSLYLNHVYS